MLLNGLMLLPVKLDTLQTVAHFLVLGDVVLLGILIVRFIGKMLSRLLWIFIFAVAIMGIFYLIAVFSQPGYEVSWESAKKKLYEMVNNTGYGEKIFGGRGEL